MSGRVITVFLDEGGNLDFSPSGTRYFCLTTITRDAQPPQFLQLNDLRADLAAGGACIPYFHASEDRQVVRDAVFKIICSGMGSVRIDSLIVEKSKTGPALTHPMQFYPKMLWYLLRWLIDDLRHRIPINPIRICLVTDTLPVSTKRKAVEKAIHERFATLRRVRIEYELIHAASRDHLELQVADYCNWAIYRKWEMGDLRSYKLIRRHIRSEFDIFRSGQRHYYQK